MIKFKIIISVLFLTLLFSCGNSKGDRNHSGDGNFISVTDTSDRKFISVLDSTKSGDGNFKGDRKFISVLDSTKSGDGNFISVIDSTENGLENPISIQNSPKIETPKPQAQNPNPNPESPNPKTQSPIPQNPKPNAQNPKPTTPKPEISENPVKIDTPTTPTIPITPPLSHLNFNTLLVKFVSPTGKVNYKGFQQVEKELDQYLEDLSENTPQSNWKKNKQLAYWLNAYNAFTIKKILMNYPVKSIMELSNGKVWDDKWIKLGDKTYSLNQIEHEIIRPTFKDARIHFAVNCAAKSCPPLSNGAFTETNVQQKLEGLAKSFVNNSSYNIISADQATISKIFDWYKADFGNVVEYLNSFSSTKLLSDANISFKEYDWSLND